MALTARGARNMDDGEEQIEEPGMLEQLQQQANKVYRESLLFGIGLTVLTLVLP